MPPDPEAVWLLATAVKEAVEDGYVTEGVELPERRLVTPGQPAWDCEGLYVQAEATFGIGGAVTIEQMEAQRVRAPHAMRAVRVGVTLLRCVPAPDDEGNPPSAESEEAAAQVILTDTQLLLNVLVAAEKRGDLPGCSSLAYEGWTSAGPEGGLAGGILRVRLAVGL